MENEMLTTTEAAKLLGCSASTVRRMLDHGILNGYRIPTSTHRRVAKTEVERLKVSLFASELSRIVEQNALVTPEA